MKKIGIIIGTERDLIPSREYYKKYKKIFQESLKELDLNVGIYDLSYDIQIFALAKKFAPKNVEIVPLWKLEYTLKELNELDLIYCIYEFPPALQDYGIDGPRKLKRLLKNTTTKILPSYEFLEFVYKKETYMKYFKTNNIPILDTLFYNLNLYKKDKNNLKFLMKRIENKFKGKPFFCKPEGSSFAEGTRIFKRLNIKTMKKYLDKCLKKGFNKILIQPFIQEFLKYYEIKTIWLNGKFEYAYGIKALMDREFIGHYEIDPKLLKMLVEKGKEVLRLIKKKFGIPFILRIDWGCCLQNDNLCRDYFLNEIEFSPAMNHDDSFKGDFFKKIAQTLPKRL